MRGAIRCLFLITFVLACRPYGQYRQVQTIVRMRAITTALEDLREKGTLTDKTAQVAIARVGHGTDAWGTPLAFRLQAAPRVRYILISAGSDKAFDVADLNAYFELKRHEVRSDPRKDIVFRDGDLVTLAGK